MTVFHLAHQQPREAVGEGAGLALGKIDQDVGDLGRLLGQVDAANGVGLVFGSASLSASASEARSDSV